MDFDWGSINKKTGVDELHQYRVMGSTTVKECFKNGVLSSLTHPEVLFDHLSPI
jgi:hypothetical protein